MFAHALRLRSSLVPDPHVGTKEMPDVKGAFAVAASFILGCLITDGAKPIWKAWDLYGVYISLWLEQYATFFLALCAICATVAAVYAIVLSPLLFTSKPPQDYKYTDGELYISIV